MKPSALFLSLCLVANLALATALIVPGSISILRSSGTSNGPTLAARQAGARDTQPQAISRTDLEKNAHVPPIPNLWARLYSGDIDQLVSRLKAAGFSYREIRSIVMSLAGKKFESRREEILSTEQTAPYWRSSTYQYMPENPRAYAELMDLMQEQSKLYQKYFAGPEAFADDEDMAKYARRRFGDLPLEKLQQISRIQGDYDELEQETYTAAQKRPNRQLTADDQNRLNLLRAELDHDIQEALTPEQYTGYLLRRSPTAERLRYQLDLFRPTEAEYKTLFALQRPTDEQFGIRVEDENIREEYDAAMKAIAPQIEAALGPERYADYKQAIESRDDKVTRLMVRLDLPLRTVGRINTVRDDITKRASAVRADKQLTPAERDAQLAALAQEAQTKLTTTLGGSRGYEAYNDVKGDWLRALQPKPATP